MLHIVTPGQERELYTVVHIGRHPSGLFTVVHIGRHPGGYYPRYAHEGGTLVGIILLSTQGGTLVGINPIINTGRHPGGY